MNWIITTIMLLTSPAWASEQPPELWSWFKDLDKSKEACEIQSSYILQSIALENQIENDELAMKMLR